MEQDKNEWEKIKENTKALKGAARLVFSALFWGFMMMMGIWAFLETIFQVTLTFVQVVLITAGIFLIFIVKSWRSDRQQKREAAKSKVIQETPMENPFQNQNIKDSSKRELENIEMQFVPTHYPGMEKQWGASSKPASSSNQSPQEKQPKPKEDEFQVVFHEKNPNNPKNDDNE